MRIFFSSPSSLFRLIGAAAEADGTIEREKGERKKRSAISLSLSLSLALSFQPVQIIAARQ